MDHTQLLQLALASLLTGGGTYAGLRALRDLPSQGAEPEKPRNLLEITLPESRMPKLAADWLDDWLVPALVGGGGLVGGYAGTGAIYEAMKKKHIENQLKKTENEYMQTLQAANQKLGELKTPLTDQFLEGMLNKFAEEISKEATANSTHTGRDILSGWWDQFSHSDWGAPALAGLALTALLSGGATYHIANNLGKKQKEVKQQTTLPTDISLNVVPVHQ